MNLSRTAPKDLIRLNQNSRIKLPDSDATYVFSWLFSMALTSAFNTVEKTLKSQEKFLAKGKPLLVIDIMNLLRKSYEKYMYKIFDD